MHVHMLFSLHVQPEPYLLPLVPFSCFLYLFRCSAWQAQLQAHMHLMAWQPQGQQLYSNRGLLFHEWWSTPP